MKTFGGCDIHKVEPGTEIENPYTGEKLTVTDTEAVFLGASIYCTPRVVDELRRQSHENSNGA